MTDSRRHQHERAATQHPRVCDGHEAWYPALSPQAMLNAPHETARGRKVHRRQRHRSAGKRGMLAPRQSWRVA